MSWSMDELQALCRKWELEQNEGDDITGDGFLSWLCWETGIYTWERETAKVYVEGLQAMHDERHPEGDKS